MRKSLTAAILLAAGSMLVATSRAQQTPAATTSTPTAGSSTPAKKSTATGSKAAATSATALTTRKQKFSYALGMQIGTGLGQNLKRQSIEFDSSLLAQGLKDSLAGTKPRLTMEEAQAVLKEVQEEVQKEQQAKQKEAADKNKTEGLAFLAANKSKEGVVTLPSGLQYKILTAGTGPKPTAADTVVCNYKGTLVDGKEFDSSYKRGQPATFPVGGVIKGWTEALQLMPVGSKWQLFIPPDLAYGERGAGAEIGPDSTLIFEVELISIKEKGKDDAQKDDTKKDQDQKSDQKDSDKKDDNKKDPDKKDNQ
jgi:FKBP-type peptidyl-prolyl cis-trans isomerase FklB